VRLACDRGQLHCKGLLAEDSLTLRPSAGACWRAPYSHVGPEPLTTDSTSVFLKNQVWRLIVTISRTKLIKLPTSAVSTWVTFGRPARIIYRRRRRNSSSASLAGIKCILCPGNPKPLRVAPNARSVSIVSYNILNHSRLWFVRVSYPAKKVCVIFAS